MDKLFVIFKGQVNQYVQKSREAIQAQKNIKSARDGANFKNALTLDTSMSSEESSMKHEHFIRGIEESPIKMHTDTSGGGSPLVMSRQISEKTPTVPLRILLKKSTFSSKQEDNKHDEYNHLSPEEQLLLVDKTVKNKYIYEGASILEYASSLNAGDSVGGDGVFHESRYTHTGIAAEEVHVAVICKEK